MDKEKKHIRKTEILDRIEFIANSILDSSDGIIEILLANNIEGYDYYFYVASNDKNDFYVKCAQVPCEFKYDSKISKEWNRGKIKFRGANDVFKVHLYNTYNSKITNTPTDDNYEDDEKQFFAFFPGLESNILSFGGTTNNVSYIPFYNFINHLLLNVNVPKKMLFECNDEDYIKSARHSITELENEMSEFMKKYESGRNLSFEIKINKEWKNTDFIARANKIFKAMDNSDIIYTLLTTEYVHQIVDVDKYIKPLSFNYDSIIYYHPDKIINYFIDMLENKNYILGLGLSEEYTKMLLDKTRIDYYFKLFLTVMPNDQIIKLSTMFPDIKDRLDLYNYIKQGDYAEKISRDEAFNESGKLKHLFNSVIVERGRNYFKEGRVVLKVIKSLERYDAKVHGSEDNIYNVSIITKESEDRFEYKCDCPCDFPCKHVYATLLAIDESNKISDIIYDKHVDEWQQIIDYLSEYKCSEEEYKEKYKELISMINKSINEDIIDCPDYYRENILTFIMDLINHIINHTYYD